MTTKTIKLFLLDGTPSGVVVADISNWSGKIFVAPRSQLTQLKGRPEVRSAGVYFLVGPDPDVPGKERVYIGESNGVYRRLEQHNSKGEKDFYSRAIILVGKDDQLTQAHARYLENQLIGLARTNGNATLTNDTKGSPDIHLPESDVADMEVFLTTAQLILPVLGFPYTQPKLNIQTATAKAAQVAAALGTPSAAESSPLFLLDVAGAHATAQEVAGQFFLLEKSKARKTETKAWTAFRGQRQQLVKDNKLRDSDDPALYVASEDIPCNSPSAAASFVAARNVNGRKAWKTQEGQTYQQWHASVYG